MPKDRIDRIHRTVQPAADAASRGARSIASAEPAVARTAGVIFRAVAKLSSFALKGAATAVVTAGELVRAGGDSVGGKGALGRTAQLAGRVTSGAAGLLGGAAWIAGEGADKLSTAAPHVGAATGGALAGAANAVAGTFDHIAIRTEDVNDLAGRLKRQSVEYAKLGNAIRQGIDSASRTEKRSRILDSVALGGVSLAAIAGGARVPDEVVEAYRLAYPDLAAEETFQEAVRRLDADQLAGFVSGVKGKLFELRYVDWLNEGHLPDGLHAEVARSATQPGWDIAIIDASGRTVDVLQAKATESAEYVKQALERYPHIDVVATEEVQRELALQGLGEQVTSGHVSEAQLEAIVSGGVDSAAGDAAETFLPSAAGLALIALFAFSDTAKSWAERSRNFGHRAGQGALATAAGGAVMVATHTWWLSVASAMGSRYLWGAGNAKRDRLERLQALVGRNERDIRKLRGVVARVPSDLPGIPS